jgi:hypothetical protein
LAFAYLHAGAAGVPLSPENAHLVFRGGGGYFFQEVEEGIVSNGTPVLTWAAGLDLRVGKFGFAYALTLEPSYAYKEPGSPFEASPLVSVYHHAFSARWFFLALTRAAFSLAGCVTYNGVYTAPDPIGNVKGTGLFKPGFYAGCYLKVTERLRTEWQVGFLKRVKPTRRANYPFDPAYTISDTWAAHLTADYWFWDLLGAGVRTSVYFDGPGEPKTLDILRKEFKIDYPSAFCWAIFVGPSINIAAFSSSF